MATTRDIKIICWERSVVCTQKRKPTSMVLWWIVCNRKCHSCPRNRLKISRNAIPLRHISATTARAVNCQSVRAIQCRSCANSHCTVSCNMIPLRHISATTAKTIICHSAQAIHCRSRANSHLRLARCGRGPICPEPMSVVWQYPSNHDLPSGRFNLLGSVKSKRTDLSRITYYPSG